ncbi:aldose 1-epimerase [Anaerocolumna cellulosilytica]|uniref:Aldose 1-epimerase n=1 Tax=Anaerocolumna cellulosilytica TaxID=433286 RepID=A0A6S6R2V7_9FIRM|nr:aldose epimerase family protein [Anaerocolumna cellulosilytica]MBB5194557.1 aldose 1-epimerase [Anaerocolumna cellulosilytica]BCJ93501.1 aldose 1-epimerase [Anaerocolumna cellulosilytica]
MSIKKHSFGKTKDGKEATLYTLINKNGMSVSFTNYGANIVNILVPDKNGKLDDVVLGYDNVRGYEINSPGYGSFIGRHANRIGGAVFVLNDKKYELEKNDGENNLHGGFKSYNKFWYEVETFEEEDADSIEFSRLSPDMEQGFPGNLDISVTYTLTDDNELVIEYLAVSDKDTVVNLTNHSYFNLSGHNSGSVLKQKVILEADKFTPTDAALIPTGELRDVNGTPMDFRTLKALGQDIEEDYEPLKLAGGYDHNFVLNTNGSDVEKIGEMIDDKSGRKMEIFTNMPGIQLYTGNFISGKEAGKGGYIYQKRDGVCFETQYFPDSCNKGEFPSSILKAGNEYDFVTVFKFSADK